MQSPPNNPLDVIAGRDQEIGPFLAIFIIMILLVIGAVYFWKEESAKNPAGNATTTEVIIHRRAQSPAASAQTNATSTGNAELDAIRDSMESQTGSVNNLNF